MNICFRADASVAIGSGHVMRCLTLAAGVKAAGGNVLFLCRDISGNLADLIRRNGFMVELLPNSAEILDWQQDSNTVIQTIVNNQMKFDWMIVDSYALDWRWETAVRLYCKQIMVIDDLANRQHDCDLLLDQNYYSDMFSRYENLVPSKCRLLLGPQHALLRPEFFEARSNLQPPNDMVKRILVFFGGSDPTNETLKTLQATEILQLSEIAIDVVVGSSNPNQEAIKEMCMRVPGCIFHCQINNMAELMAQADFAIGAGGTASWERCFLGLPTIGIIVADNQKQLVADLAESGAMISLGRSSAVTLPILAEAIRRLLNDNELRKKISHRCLELMSGYGTKSVISALMGESNV